MGGHEIENSFAHACAWRRGTHRVFPDLRLIANLVFSLDANLQPHRCHYRRPRPLPRRSGARVERVRVVQQAVVKVVVQKTRNELSCGNTKLYMDKLLQYDVVL